MIKEVGDAVETHLRVEIASDEPGKVIRFSKMLCELIRAMPSIADHDVMVTVHDITDNPEPKP